MQGKDLEQLNGGNKKTRFKSKSKASKKENSMQETLQAMLMLEMTKRLGGSELAASGTQRQTTLSFDNEEDRQGSSKYLFPSLNV